ncbi:unnamed protein product [Gordionus sp. m RMFG-2023]
MDYELNTHDLLTDIVNPTDIYEKEILELDNSFNKENINPCSSKRKNLDTPKSKAKKSKKYEDEKMEIFRGFAAKHTSQGDDPHNIMDASIETHNLFPTWLSETALFPHTIWKRYHVDGPNTNN